MRFSSRTIGDRMHNAVKRVTVEDTERGSAVPRTYSRFTPRKSKKRSSIWNLTGFASRVLKPTGGANKKKAEGIMMFTGGNRSHGAFSWWATAAIACAR